MCRESMEVAGKLRKLSEFIWIVTWANCDINFLVTDIVPVHSKVIMASVVLDIGKVNIKYGIAGESSPRGIIKSNLWKVLD